jgi:hypothetical protein
VPEHSRLATSFDVEHTKYVPAPQTLQFAELGLINMLGTFFLMPLTLNEQPKYQRDVYHVR